MGCLARRSRAEPAWRIGGASIAEGTSHHSGGALSWILFPNLKGRDRTRRGGALNYVVKGKMIGGFALIAYPRVRKFRRHDLHGQSCRYRLPEGSRNPYREHRKSIYLFDPDQTWKKWMWRIPEGAERSDAVIRNSA